MKKVVFSIRLYVWMCVSLAREEWDGFCYCSAFKSLFILGWRSVIMKNLALENRDLSHGLKIRNGDFMENYCGN
jgi:hypothetical protein